MSTIDLLTAMKEQLAVLSAKVEALEQKKTNEKKHTRAYEVVSVFVDEYTELTGEINVLRYNIDKIDARLQTGCVQIRELALERTVYMCKLTDLLDRRAALRRAILEAADANFQ